MNTLTSGTRFGFSGKYGLRVSKANSGIIVGEYFGVDGAGIHNDITDTGLNRIGTDSAFQYCFLGTGSSVPATTDTQMGAFGVYTNIGAPSIPADPAPTSPDYISTRNKGFRFNAGVATGTWSEVGIGWFEGAVNSTNHRIWSRVKIVDGLGTPVTITLLADEVLDVFYTLQASMPLVDGSGSVVLDGITYNYVSRQAQATTSKLGQLTGSANLQMLVAYSGGIGPITGVPSGSQSTTSGASSVPYVNNSLTLKHSVTAGLDNSNLAGGIKSLLTSYYYAYMLLPDTQFEFDNPIPKDNTKVLSLELSFSWGRA